MSHTVIFDKANAKLVLSAIEFDGKKGSSKEEVKRAREILTQNIFSNVNREKTYFVKNPKSITSKSLALLVKQLKEKISLLSGKVKDEKCAPIKDFEYEGETITNAEKCTKSQDIIKYTIKEVGSKIRFSSKIIEFEVSSRIQGEKPSYRRRPVRNRRHAGDDPMINVPDPSRPPADPMDVGF